MYGAGHIMDMINRMKQNRALRPSNRLKFKENNRDGLYADPDESTELPIFKTVSEKELNEIKIRIREQAKIEQRRMRIIYVVICFCGLVALIGFLIWAN